MKPKSGYRSDCTRRGRGKVPGQLLRKEKDEASPTDCFRQDSLNAFIPRFAGVWRLFHFLKVPGSALVSQPKPFRIFVRGIALKDQFLKRNIGGWALVCLFATHNSIAVSLDDIPFWTGSGTNRAALVIEWSSPETFDVGNIVFSTVPAPIASKTLVWGYRFNGTVSGADMFQAVLVADPALYSVIDPTYGTYVVGLGYRLSGTGLSGIRDDIATNYFNHRYLTNATVNVDAAGPVLGGDVYWGGYFGPNWEMWVEKGGAGGFTNAPDRGTPSYWTSTDPDYFSTGFHGQWDLASTGLDGMNLTEGSWVGFSVAAGSYPFDSDPAAPYFIHKHAPALPDAGFTAAPVQIFSGQFLSGHWQCSFDCRTNWIFRLERSSNFVSWTEIANETPVENGRLVFQDTNPVVSAAFYRIRADRP